MKINNQPLSKVFMKHLKEVRESRGISIDDLVKDESISRKRIEDLENFKELLDMNNEKELELIAKVYNIDWKQFSEHVYDEENDSWYYKVPILGKVQCGTPVYAQEYIEDYKLLPFEYKDRGNYFYLEAKGDSMIDLDINEGDLLLIKQTRNLSKGEVGVIQVEGMIDIEATLKIYFPEKDKIILRAANKEYEDIEISGNDIFGVKICGRLEQVEKRDYTYEDLKKIF